MPAVVICYPLGDKGVTSVLRMRDAGGKVVVAQSYARIFFRNCVSTCASPHSIPLGPALVNFISLPSSRISIYVETSGFFSFFLFFSELFTLANPGMVNLKTTCQAVATP